MEPPEVGRHPRPCRPKLGPRSARAPDAARARRRCPRALPARPDARPFGRCRSGSRFPRRCCADASTHVRRTATHGSALVHQLATGHCPALVHLADNGLGRQHHVIKELFAELVGAADHPDPAQGHSLGPDRHQEHGQPAMLGRVPVGAGQAQAPVRGIGRGAPGLGAVEHPGVAVTLGPGDHPGQIRTPAGSDSSCTSTSSPRMAAPMRSRFCCSLPMSRIVGAQMLNVGMFSRSGIS